MRRPSRHALLALAALIAAAQAAPAWATEWSLRGNVNQRFDVDTNFDLDPTEDGSVGGDDDASFGTRTGLGLRLGAATETTTWTLASGFNVTWRSDSNDDFDATNGIFPNVNGRVVHNRPLYSLSSGFSFRRRSTEETRFIAFDDLGEPGEEDDPDLIDDFVDQGRRVIDNTVQTNFAYNAGASFRLTPLDTLNVNGNVSLVRFKDEIRDREPATSFRLGGGWSRALSPISSGGVSVSVLRFMTDNTGTPEQTDGTSASFSINYSVQPTQRHSFGFSVGASATTETEDILIGDILLTRDETTYGFNGGANFSYTGARDTFGFSISQGVRPSTFGNLRNVTSVSGSYARQLTRDVTFSMRALAATESDAAFVTSFDETRFAFSPGISYRITDDLSARLGYTFRYLDDEGPGGSAISNRVVLSLSQGFTIFP